MSKILKLVLIFYKILNDETKTDLTTYEEFYKIQSERDVGEINNWKKKPDGFDHKLIQSHINNIKDSINKNDLDSLKLLMRSTLLRNLAGVTDKKLYSVSLIETKSLIEEYLKQVCNSLDYIYYQENCVSKHSLHAQYDFYSNILKGYGNTVLIMEGGANFAMTHFGIIHLKRRNQMFI
jgi:TAG lipase/steryl ester hydrolase/phospholipase A2/LPA acyltransferase